MNELHEELIYWVCWRDPDTGETGAVVGEGPMGAWAETEEVCSYFRAEDDGLEYFVGDKDGNVLNPKPEEALWTLDYVYKHHEILAPAEAAMLRYFIDKEALKDG